jgi:hypothetical protein
VFGVLQVVSEHFLGEPHKFWSFQKLPWRKEHQLLDDIAYQKQKQEARQQEKKARSISRMRFPSFTGKNPNTWLFMAHKFFEYHQIPNRDRIHVAEFHMKEEAQYWFYNTVHGGLFYDWESFVREMQHRFRKELQEELEADRRLREADQRLHQELPDFDGYKVSAWIHKANQVFNYHRSPMYARVYLASFHMKGEALLWFKNAGQSSGGWEEFLDALQAKFSQEWQMQQAIQQLVHSVEESRQSMEEYCKEGRKFCSQMISELDNMLNICQELDEEEARTESIKAEMASKTQVTMEEGLGLSTEMESMNTKNPSQISKDVEISVNRQMFDEITQPIQTALRISEYVGMEIIDLMWKNLGVAENLMLVMKMMPKIVVNYSTASCVMVLVFKHRWRWKFSNKHPSSVIVSSTGAWVRECRDDCTLQFQPEPEEILDRRSPNMNSESKN